MLHFVHQCALQPEHICGQRVIENLPATVVEHLVAKGPPAEHSVEIFTARALAQKTCASVNSELVGLQGFHECQFFSRKFAKARPLAQRTSIARRDIAVWPSVSDNHGCSFAGSRVRLRRKAKEARPHEDEFARPMSFLNAVILNS